MPEWPAELEPSRARPWLVQPGIHSIEAYEAIITETEGSCSPLNRYICQTGVGQAERFTENAVAHMERRDHGACEERDICFTMLSPLENMAVAGWLSKRSLRGTINSTVTTPFGIVRVIGSQVMSTKSYESLEQDALRELGIDGLECPRSNLPPGIIPLVDADMHGWRLPGPDGVARDGRATDDCGIERIEYIMPASLKRKRELESQGEDGAQSEDKAQRKIKEDKEPQSKA